MVDSPCVKWSVRTLILHESDHGLFVIYLARVCQCQTICLKEAHTMVIRASHPVLLALLVELSLNALYDA
ncbi:hypothetical protein D3C74_39700 [compost metagenome]